MEAIILKIKRSGSANDGAKPCWQSFRVPVPYESMSVLDALMWVQRNADQSLAFRCACRVGMCGTCGNVINNREGLACRTLVRSLVGEGGEIRVEPMRHMPVVRDLVTDMSAFHAKLTLGTPLFSLNASSGGIANNILPDSRERQSIDPQRECIYCGLCYSACTVVGLDEKFLGPAAMNRAFVALLDSRNEPGNEDFDTIAHEHGLWRCHTLFECTAVCPKGISPTLAIQSMKRKVIGRKLKHLFKIRG